MDLKFLGAQDFWCGLLLVAIAAFFLLAGRDLAIGTSLRMGPGYAPHLLAGFVGAAGIGLCARGLFAAEGTRLQAMSLRPLVFVLGAVAMFALLLERLGLVLTTFVVVAVASAALAGRRIGETLALAAAVAAICAVVFVYGLKLIIPLWPSV